MEDAQKVFEMIEKNREITLNHLHDEERFADTVRLFETYPSFVKDLTIPGYYDEDDMDSKKTAFMINKLTILRLLSRVYAVKLSVRLDNKEQWEALANVYTNGTHCSAQLELWLDDITEETAEYLRAILSMNRVHYLKLTGGRMSDQVLEVLLKTDYYTRHTLHLCNVDMDGKALPRLTLQNLKLECMDVCLDTMGLDALASLRFLKFDACKVSGSCELRVLEGLVVMHTGMANLLKIAGMKAPKLEYIHVERVYRDNEDKRTHEDFEKFLGSFPTCKTLVAKHIGGTIPVIAGPVLSIEPIFNALPNLKKLDLSENRLCVEALEKYLPKFEQLKKLILLDCPWIYPDIAPVFPQMHIQYLESTVYTSDCRVPFIKKMTKDIKEVKLVVEGSPAGSQMCRRPD